MAPWFLPDGRHFVYLAGSSEQGRTEVRAGALDSKDDKSLFAVNSQVLYAPPGYLLFVRNRTLMAQPFDERSLSLTGDVFPVAERIASNPSVGFGAFSVSKSGTLIYRSVDASETSELTWLDRSGKKLDVVRTTGNFINPSLSPDGNRVALETLEAARDIWVIDLARGTNSRFTFDPANDIFPVFSPDAKQILFASNRGGAWGLYAKPATGVGAEQLLQKGPQKSRNE